ncbi:GntR family transcriptional regulator [Mangrovibacter sp. SLW1]
MAKKTVEVICEALAERIQRGEFNEDRRLPSERTLSQQFMTTRITLREALRQLEAQGVIYREVRRGWFIAPPRLVYNPLHHSHFREMAQAQGRHTSTELINAGFQPASEVVAHQLGIPRAVKSFVFAACAILMDGRCYMLKTHLTQVISQGYWKKT